MPDGWSGVFRSIQGQGKSPTPAAPKSPTDVYFAYLDKADWDVTTNTWFLMFDMLPAEAAIIGLKSDVGDAMPPPRVPTIIFHAHGVTKDAVYAALGLTDTEEPAEGSWYALFLESGGDPKTQLVGDLYHPDNDFLADQPDYGQWYVSRAQLLTLPGPPKPAPPRPVPARRRSRSGGPQGKTVPRTYTTITGMPLKGLRFKPYRKRMALSLRRIAPPAPPPPPPPPPPPGFGALGVMAIGQGGFNLFFERGTREPLTYYDAGYPLGFYHSSVPNPMRVGNAAFQGPIMQNAAGTLEVILSHWDWDHWRFGAFVNGVQTLGNLPWTVPQEQMSPTAAMWLAGIPNAVMVVPNTPAQARANGVTLFKLQPGAAPAPFYVNNSGLAIHAPVDVGGVPSAGTILTGDANFNFLPGAALAGPHVVGAVHHGSSNHGAAANIPLPAVGGTGRVAYSYGITAAGNHCYGFPTALAVGAYRALNWTAPTEQATAEGPNINVGPAAAGNIRVGDQLPLPGGYAGTAFAAIGYALP